MVGEIQSCPTKLQKQEAVVSTQSTGRGKTKNWSDVHSSSLCPSTELQSCSEGPHQSLGSTQVGDLSCYSYQGSKKDTKMAVMFIRDVPGVAEEGEEKKVAKGYARNYLFPRDLAVYATPAIREKYAQMGIVCCFLSEFNLQRVQKNGSYGSRWLNPDKGLAKLHWK
eukprot:TRINITY_DN1323_c0_g1_i3.p1 TRINITY_DN1323_c0_g1~~TRINITY_DN1323_c0_g1_i3.p1  ORF type:complete len:167 (-),score=33.59 TRINITY_DN1323_c0_g1_i3:190-690(-)